jgi:hypothetical protein
MILASATPCHIGHGMVSHHHLDLFPAPQDFRGTCRGGGLDDVTESVQHLEGRQAREDYDGALVVLSNGRRPPSGFASGAFSARFNRAISN